MLPKSTTMSRPSVLQVAPANRASWHVAVCRMHSLLVTTLHGAGLQEFHCARGLDVLPAHREGEGGFQRSGHRLRWAHLPSRHQGCCPSGATCAASSTLCSTFSPGPAPVTLRSTLSAASLCSAPCQCPPRPLMNWSFSQVSALLYRSRLQQGRLLGTGSAPLSALALLLSATLALPFCARGCTAVSFPLS